MPRKWKIKTVDPDGKRNSEYSIWSSMKDRCFVKTHHAYKDYGGRGITVCERWINSFDDFIEDMGKRPSNRHTLDRIDNNQNYTPENCRWTTMKEQCNNRRNNRILECNGIKKSLAEWVTDLGISRSSLKWHLKKKTLQEIYNNYKKNIE